MLIQGISPYMFHIGPLGIRWYGFFMAVSMAIGIVLFVRRGRAVTGNEDLLYNVALYGIIAGVVGARLVYVITSPTLFLHDPAEIPRIDHGGLSIHGALLGGLTFAWWYARRHRLPIWHLLDSAVPGLCIGIILVRIGNIFNQEILGHPSAFWFGRQPAQIYGSLIGVILIWLYYRKAATKPPDGYLFWYFVAGYTILRFCNEFFRDNPQYLIHWTNSYLGIGAVTLTQWASPFVFALAVWQMGVRLRLNRHAPAVAPAGEAGLPEARPAVPGGSDRAVAPGADAHAATDPADTGAGPSAAAGRAGDEEPIEPASQPGEGSQP